MDLMIVNQETCLFHKGLLNSILMKDNESTNMPNESNHCDVNLSIRNDAYSVPFCLRILNCSGERIARHSSSGLLTDPGAEEAIAAIRPLRKPRRRDGGEEGMRRRLRFAGGERESRWVARQREGVTKDLMVEEKVKEVAEDTRTDDCITFNAILAFFFLSLSSFSDSFFFMSNLRFIWALLLRPLKPNLHSSIVSMRFCGLIVRNKVLMKTWL